MKNKTEKQASYRDQGIMTVPGASTEYYFHMHEHIDHQGTLRTWLTDDPPPAFTKAGPSRRFLFVEMHTHDHEETDRIERHFVMLNDLSDFVAIMGYIRHGRAWEWSYYALLPNPFV